MIKQRRWPIPADTPTDRARTIARGLLHLLEQRDPQCAAEVAEQARGFGEDWLTPTIDTSQGHYLTPAEAAAVANRRVATIYQWISRGTRYGKLTRHPGGISERELLALISAMRHGLPHEAAHPTEATPS